MISQIQKPEITHTDDRRDIEILETWAKNTTDLLNYLLNHIDEDNLTEELREAIQGR